MTKVVYPVIGRQTSLPFYLTGIGISDPEYHVVREKGLVSHQLLFTSGGEGRLIVDGCEYIQTAGSAFYLPPSLPHEYYPSNGSWITNWIVFRGEYASQMLANMGFDGFKFTPEINTDKPAQLFERIFAAAADPVSFGEKASVLVYEYILAMKTAMLSPDSRKNVGSITRQALLYIDSCYMNDITTETLAGLSGVTVQHFCRVFRAETSMRPLEYIARRRIAQAKSLLLNTDTEIGEIGRLVGYEDRNYFSIVFKKLEGVSPRDYRRSRGTGSL